MLKEILKNIEKISDYLYKIPPIFDFMQTPALIYANDKILSQIKDDETLIQLVKSTALPGIVNYSIVMPDAHQGYGLPIGGVVATDFEKGVITPGGVGYDINCGVRLLRTNLYEKDIKPHLSKLMDLLFSTIPSGIGKGRIIKLNLSQLNELLSKGMKWAYEKGFATLKDIDFSQDKGSLIYANPDKIDKKSKERGLSEIGSLGAGNHFLEIQVVKEIFDKKLASYFSLNKDQVFIMLHTGSRGLGHGVCGYYLKLFEKEMKKDKLLSKLFKLEKKLASLYMKNQLAKDYFEAMNAAANFAFVNRQLITHKIRLVFEEIFSIKWDKLDLSLVYDITHNIAKKEEYIMNGKKKTLLVHRKGATRILPKGSNNLNELYKKIGEPTLLPGAMGKDSFLLVSNQEHNKNFYSCSHGSGRVLSRIKARKLFKGSEVKKELESLSIQVRVKKSKGKGYKRLPYDPLGELAEENWRSYKDPYMVLQVCEKANLIKKVASFRSIAVMKG